MKKVLIIDDSAVMRKILTEQLSKFADIRVVGTAIDPYIARDKIVRLKPDVLVLDMILPRMDGLSFLRKLMKYHPIPVVVFSSVTPRDSETAIKALQMGAIEVIQKHESAQDIPITIARLVNAIRTASYARIKKAQPAPKHLITIPLPPLEAKMVTKHIIAIGASTGGTQALELILSQLPRNTPGIVIVQHMPEHFTQGFAKRLDQISTLTVKQATHNDEVKEGMVLIAPGNCHMLVQPQNSKYRVHIKDGPPVHHQRPSVDVLFHSVAQHARENAIGILLSGMGHDGAGGLLAMKEQGAYTIAQNEESCVVFGMPREAIERGAVKQVLPLNSIAVALLNHLSEPRARKGKTSNSTPSK
jgi:two-component system chemotaxis response regulator CheB